MARRNRETFKKREREMARKQKKQDKAQRMADRKAGRSSSPLPEEEPSVQADSGAPFSSELEGPEFSPC